MLKNIKLFSTDNDRTTYESSASYETPYVSKVAADNSVHYNKQIRTIEFTIQERHYDSGSHLVTTSVQYSALEGMTWQSWINSEYNIHNFRLSDGSILYENNYSDYGIWFSVQNNNLNVAPGDTIIENNTYTTAHAGADQD